MKAYLSYNLNSKEDSDRLEIARKADQVLAFLDTWYVELFRPHLKYYEPVIEGRELTQSDIELLEAMADKIGNYLEELGL